MFLAMWLSFEMTHAVGSFARCIQVSRVFSLDRIRKGKGMVPTFYVQLVYLDKEHSPSVTILGHQEW